MQKTKIKIILAALAVLTSLGLALNSQKWVLGSQLNVGTQTSVDVVAPGGGGQPPYIPVCGNGIVDNAIGEECDDGNTQVGDGCDAACRIEPILLSPSTCTGVPSASFIEWNWTMPGGSEHDGFRLVEAIGASETTLVETLNPLAVSANETSLPSNTQYANRAVYSILNGGVKSDTSASCNSVYTLIPDPTLAPVLTSQTLSVQADVPAGTVINSQWEGQTAVWFEIHQELSGILTPLDNSSWITNTSVNFEGLDPSTEYTIFYKLRNFDGIETNLSPAAIITTLPVSGNASLIKSATTAFPDEAEIDEVITYRIDYENSTNVNLENVVVEDDLPASVQYIPDSLVSNDAGMALGFDEENARITAARTISGPAESAYIEYQVRVIGPSALSPIENQAEVSFEIADAQFVTPSNLVSLFLISSEISASIVVDENYNGEVDEGEGPEGLGEPNFVIYRDDNGTEFLETEEDLEVLAQPLVGGTILLTELPAGRYFFVIPETPAGYNVSESNVYQLDVQPGSLNDMSFLFEPIVLSAEFDIKAKPEKRAMIGDVQDLSLEAQLQFKDLISNDIMVDEAISLDADGQAIYTDESLVAGDYDISLKGSAHLSKVLRDIAVLPGPDAIEIDFTEGDSAELIAGDLFSDDLVNAFDLTTLLISYGSAGPVEADFNKDNFVNAPDIALMVLNYFKTGDTF